MPRIWDLIDKETQDRLIVLIYLLQLKEHPDKEPFWLIPTPEEWDRVIVVGKIEDLEEIDHIMRQPAKIRRPHK